MKTPLLFIFVIFSALRLEAAPTSLNNQLLNAAEKGDTKTAQSLIKRGAMVNARNADGATPLMLATRNSNEPLVNFLLAHGADVRARDKWGFSCMGYGPFAAETFLKRGAKATPNDAAALSDWLENTIWIDSDVEDEDVRAETRMFLRAGMNLNTRGFDENGSTPLMNAVDSRPSLAPFLLALGANPNIADGRGRTPLIAAILPSVPFSDTGEAVALSLLANGAKLNTRDAQGQTALMVASTTNRLNLARELIKRGADVNIRDKRGENALMRTATGGFPDIARLLLASGANPNLKNTQGRTALDLARSREFVMQSFISPMGRPDMMKAYEEEQNRELERAVRGRLEVQALLEKQTK